MDTQTATQRQLQDSALPSALLDTDRLYALAPLELRYTRQTRYHADERWVALEALDQADQALLRRLYATLAELLALLVGPTAPTEAARLKLLTAWVAQINLADLLTALRNLGGPTEAGHPGPQVRRVLNTLRGGRLTTLVVELQIIALRLGDPTDLPLLECAARDYLTSLRACVPELDPPPSRQTDGPPRERLCALLETWLEHSLAAAGVAAQVLFDCRFFGPVAETDPEFAAVDRTLTSLVCQAARTSEDALVGVSVLPVPPDQPHSVRFVVAGQPTPPLRRGARLERLFLEGCDNGGLALPLSAEAVVAAYGLERVEQALRDGHIGAALLDDSVVYWFHWPTVAR